MPHTRPPAAVGRSARTASRIGTFDVDDFTPADKPPRYPDVEHKRTAKLLKHRLRVVWLTVLAVLALVVPWPGMRVVDVPSTEWPMYQGRADHNAVVPSRNLRADWTSATGQRINGGLALIGTTIYVAGNDGNAYAFDASTGALRWLQPLGNATMTAPVVVDGLLFFGTGRNGFLIDTPNRVVWGRPQGDAIVALDALNGEIVWRFRTVGEDMPTPALVTVRGQTELVFANGDDHVYALDPTTGKLLWKTAMFGVSTMSSLAASGHTVVGLFNLSQHYGDENATNASRYRLRSRTWALDVEHHRFRWMTPFGNADCSPAIAGNSVFVETEHRLNPAGSVTGPATNTVAALDLRSGTMRWAYTSAPGAWSGTGSDEEAIAGLYAAKTFFESLPYPRQFAAFDAVTGRLRWILKTRAPVKMSAVEDGGRLYFGDTGGTLYVVAARNGTVLERTQYSEPFGAAPPLIAGSTLYIPNGKRLVARPLDALAE